MLMLGFTPTWTLACEVWQGVDLASYESEVQELESRRMDLDFDQFRSMPAFSSFDWNGFANCRGNLRLKKLYHLQKKVTAHVIVSVDDACDGGNSQGALLSQDQSQVIGDIGDSQISCLEKPISFVPDFE